MSQEELQHYGVLGMKWGVRKAKQIVKREEAFLKNMTPLYNKIHAKASPGINKRLKEINSKDKYKNKDLNQDRKLRQEYLKELSPLIEKELNAVAFSKRNPFTWKTTGSSPEGTIQMSFSYNDAGVETYKLNKSEKIPVKLDRQLTEITQSSMDELFIIFLETDTTGKAIKSNTMETQQADLSEEDLIHFGRLGMKWGQRIFGSRRSTGPTGPTGPKSEDHIQTRQIKRKQVSEMTTQELQQLTQRLNLEKQYSQLNPKQVSAGKKIASKFVSKIGDSLVNAAADATSSKIKKEISKYLGARNPTPTP